MTQYLKKKYNLSSYEVAQIEFLIKTLVSEFSKIIIMAFLFHKDLPLYFSALFFMIILRCTTGGIHFYTYKRCLIGSTIYLWLAITLLPQMMVPLYIKVPLLLVCLLFCYYIGPVRSRYRSPYSEKLTQRNKKLIASFIFISTLIIYIIPDNRYLDTGFWIIILHTLQLIIAKLLKKGAE